MGLDALVRKGVALADKLTKSLQVTVEYKPWVDATSQGKAIYGASLFLLAIVEPVGQFKNDKDSNEVRARMSKVMFLQIVPQNGAPKRRMEPIDPRDLLVLPDGTSNAILRVIGMTDPTTSKPYFCEVLIGAR